MAGQTINDRLLAARHSLAGQGLAKSVCKATTEEMIGPKKKHLDYLVHCTNEPNVSIPHLANLLVERSQNANWVVVYKSLITVHHLLAYGNERFMQYLASSNSTFNLSNFLDKGGVQGAVGARIGYDMSPFIRRYAKYLNEKALSYRTVAFDFCKVKRGKEEGSLRTMNADKLLKTLPVLQSQLDALLEFDCTANDLTNGVINMCFMLLFRDLIRLFACYNDGIINLLEKYFDMNKKQCREALDLYKKFLVRMDRVAEFLKVAENVGIDKGDIPDLTKAPSSLLDALEQHLASVEGKKGSAANTPTQTASNQKNVKSGVSALSSTSSSFGTAAASARFDTHTNGIDDEVKALALAEEEAAMNKYKTKVSSPTNGALTNPFLSSPPSSQTSAPIVDLFGSPTGQSTDPTQLANMKTSDDLLQLGNPFADMFGGPSPQTTQPQQQPPGTNNSWMSNGFNGTSGAPPTSGNTFVSETNFSSVFGNSESIAYKFNTGRYYYLQAATTDDTLPNPFLQSDVNQTGDFYNSIDGGGQQQPQQQQNIKTGGQPPVRPPPPQSNIITSSPAHQGGITSKSAFDDLNDSIRMALGSSPIKSGIGVQPQQPSLQPQQQQPLLQQQQQQPPLSSSNFGSQQQQMFSSPAKQVGGGFDALGDVLKPGPTSILGGPGNNTNTGLALGQQTQSQTSSNPGKVLTGDLDSSLASLAENLTINKSASAQVKGVQWNSPKNAAKPGSAGWTPQPMAATTGAGYRPMAQGMNVTPAPSTIHSPLVHAPYPVIPSFMQQGMPVRPMMGAPMAGGMSMGMTQQQQSQQQMPGMMGQPMAAGQPGMMPQQTQPAQSNVQLDPFGAF